MRNSYLWPLPRRPIGENIRPSCFIANLVSNTVAENGFSSYLSFFTLTTLCHSASWMLLDLFPPLHVIFVLVTLILTGTPSLMGSAVVPCCLATPFLYQLP